MSRRATGCPAGDSAYRNANEMKRRLRVLFMQYSRALLRRFPGRFPRLGVGDSLARGYTRIIDLASICCTGDRLPRECA